MYSFLVRAGGLHDLGPSNEKVVYLTTNIEGITLTAKHIHIVLLAFCHLLYISPITMAMGHIIIRCHIYNAKC